MAKATKELKRIAKFLNYVMVLRPDEFGIIPDRNGYYKLKELLKALSEDPQGKTIRKGTLLEIHLSVPDRPLEIEGNLIRPRDYRKIPSMVIETDLPKLLYTAIRKRAWPHVAEKGIGNPSQPPVVLTMDNSLALRIGRRKDPEPVLLTVNTSQATNLGVTFKRFGKFLFIAEQVPKGCFTGPRIEKPKPTKTRETPKEPKVSKTAGSFSVNPEALENIPKHGARPAKRRKDPEWKRHRRKSRKR